MYAVIGQKTIKPGQIMYGALAALTIEGLRNHDWGFLGCVSLVSEPNEDGWGYVLASAWWDAATADMTWDDFIDRLMSSAELSENWETDVCQEK